MEPKRLMMSGTFTEWCITSTVSCVICLLLFWVILPLVLPRLIKSYGSLSTTDSLLWRSKMVSTLHGIVVSTMALYTLVQEESIHQDHMLGYTVTTYFSTAIMTGYMVSDTVTMLWYQDPLLEAIYLIHHPLAIMMGICFSINKRLSMAATLLLFSEASTPCMHMRWFLKKLGYARSSYEVRLNRWAFRCIFFICRVLIAPVIFHDAYIVYATDVYDQYRYELILSLLVLILPVILLNIYWFCIMCFGYWREISATETTQKKLR